MTDDGYAVEFGRREFLEIVHIENPRIIYRSSDRYFFLLAGLAVGSRECIEADFDSNRIVLPWILDAPK